MHGSFIRSLFREKKICRTGLCKLVRAHQKHSWTPEKFLRMLKFIGDPVIIDRLVTNAGLKVSVVLNDEPIVPRVKPKRQRRTLADAFVEVRNAAMKEIKLKTQSLNDDVEHGVTDRFDKGKRTGLKEGKAIGLKEGKAIGFQEGKNVGREEGKTIGFQKGRTIGLQEGMMAGLKRSAVALESKNHLKTMRGMTMKIIRDVHPDKAGDHLDSTYVTCKMNDLLARSNDALQT